MFEIPLKNCLVFKKLHANALLILHNSYNIKNVVFRPFILDLWNMWNMFVRSKKKLFLKNENDVFGILTCFCGIFPMMGDI